MILEVLSRLCCKSSIISKEKLLDLVPKIYSVKRKNSYQDIENLLRRLLNTYNAVEKYNLIPKLLKIPFPENILIRENIIIIRLNPFSYLNDLQESDVARVNSLSIDEQDIESLLELANSNDGSKRMWGIYSLSRLFSFDLLSSDHQKRFGCVLWLQRDNYHLPSNIEFDDYLLSNLLDLPHPEDVDPEMLIRNLLPIQTTQNEQVSTIEIYSLEAIGANPRVHWSSEEIVQILMYLIQWWDQEKSEIPNTYAHIEVHLLKPDTNNIADFASVLTQVLTRVIFPNIQENITDQEKAIIGNLVAELHEYQVPHIHIKAASSNILDIDERSIFLEAMFAVLSQEEMVVDDKSRFALEDGLRAILSLMQKSAQPNLKSTLINDLLSLLRQMIQSKDYNYIWQVFWVVKQLIKKNSQHFDCNSELGKICLYGLKSVIKKTELHEQDITSCFHKKICTRRETAAFAYELYAFYRGQKKGEPVPDEIMKWKDICSSKQEFAEIRAQWGPDLDVRQST